MTNIADMPTVSAIKLLQMTDVELRQLLAQIAGILAHREGGYASETGGMLRRIADRLNGAPRE